jgi:phage shock protein E
MMKMFRVGSERETMEINEAVKDMKNDPNARLIDVRTPQEYQSGHIPGSLLLPLDHAQNIVQLVPDKKTKIYVYCRSGVRSAKAADLFQRLGYEAVVDIGGITKWKGSLEK